MKNMIWGLLIAALVWGVIVSNYQVYYLSRELDGMRFLLWADSMLAQYENGSASYGNDYLASFFSSLNQAYTRGIDRTEINGRVQRFEYYIKNKKPPLNEEKIKEMKKNFLGPIN